MIKSTVSKVKYFGLNRMDILQREGKYPLPPGASTILGVEFSGHVAEVGQGVTQWKEGDEVFGLASGVRLVNGPSARSPLNRTSRHRVPTRST